MRYIENGKLYIQISDMNYLFTSSCYLPKSIYDKALYQSVNMTDENKDEYLVFDEPKDIEVLCSFPFIANLKDLEKKDIFELLDILEDCQEEIGRLMNMTTEGFLSYGEWAYIKSESGKARHLFNSVDEYYCKRLREERIKSKSLKPNTLNKDNNNV